EADVPVRGGLFVRADAIGVRVVPVLRPREVQRGRGAEGDVERLEAAPRRMRDVELEVPVVPDRRGGDAGGEEGREVDRRGDALIGRQLRLDQDVERRAGRDLREVRVAVVVDGHAGPVRDADAEGL